MSLKELKSDKLTSKLAKHLPHSAFASNSDNVTERLSAVMDGKKWCETNLGSQFVVSQAGTMYYDTEAKWYLSHTGEFFFAKAKHYRLFMDEMAED
jgi:hypothetical protein